MQLTDDNQTDIELEFGRLLYRYSEISSQIENLKSICTGKDGNLSKRSFAKANQERFKQWKEENQEAVNEIPELIEEFEDLFLEVGIGIGEDVDLWNSDEMESVIRDELTQMYQELMFASAISRFALEENLEENRGIISKIRSKFGL